MSDERQTSTRSKEEPYRGSSRPTRSAETTASWTGHLRIVQSKLLSTTLVLVIPGAIAFGASFFLNSTHIDLDAAVRPDMVTTMAWGAGGEKLYVGMHSGNVLAVDRSGGVETVRAQGAFTPDGLRAPVLSLHFGARAIPHALLQPRDPATMPMGVPFHFSESISPTDGLFATVAANGGSATAGEFIEGKDPNGPMVNGLMLYRDLPNDTEALPTRVAQIFGVEDVRAIAALPGTSVVIAGTGDGGVYAIDASAQIGGASPETYRRLIGSHGAAITEIAVSAAPAPDGAIFATRADDRSVKVWGGQTAEGQLVAIGDYNATDVTAMGSRWEESEIAFGLVQTVQLVSLSADGQTALLRVAATDSVGAFALAVARPVAAGGSPSVVAPDISFIDPYNVPAILTPAGDRLVATNEGDGTVELLDVSDISSNDPPVLAEFSALRNLDIRSFAFDAAGLRFLAVARDGTITVQDVRTPDRAVTIRDHLTLPTTQILAAAAISPDGTLVAASTFKDELAFHSAQNGAVLSTLQIGRTVFDFVFDVNGKLVNLYDNGRIATFSVRGQRRIATTSEVGSGTVIKQQFSQNGRRYVAAFGVAEDPLKIRLAVGDIEANLQLVNMSFALPDGIVISDDASTILMLTLDGLTGLRIFREQPNPDSAGPMPQAAAGSMRLSADGSTLIMRSVDGELHHARLVDQTPKLSRLDWPRPTLQAELAPSGLEIIIGEADGRITIADVQTLLPRGAGTEGTQDETGAEASGGLVISSHGGPISAMALSPDGEILATSSLDGRLRLTSLWALRILQSLPFAGLPTGPAIEPLAPQYLDESPYDEAIPRPPTNQFRPDRFGAVYGGHATLERAQVARQLALDAGFNDARIYLRRGSFRSVVVFASEEERNAAMPRVRALSQAAQNAYTPDLLFWCPVPEEREDYLECAEAPPPSAN